MFAARRSLRDLRVRMDDLDTHLLAPRIASALFIVAGVLALATGRLAVVTNRTSADAALAGVVLGALGLVTPWPRVSVRMQLVVPITAFALVAWAGLPTAAVAAPYLAVLPLPFVFVGIMQPPGTSTLLAPVAGLAIVVAARFEMTQTVIVTLAFALPVSVAVGEALAQSQRRRHRAEQHIGRLLHAVRVLAHVTDERDGAHLVASLACELLDADAVAVLLADSPRSGRFRSRAWFGHPALADAAPLVIDRKADPVLLRAGATTFLPDASATPLLDAPGAAGRVRSAALLALPGRGSRPLGVVVAMWGTRRQTLPLAARQASELLSQEAGRMFVRLHETAALARDAETDPLTELANRRTFARALQTMQPGDAVVLVDLDYFKSVNDRFGHEVGDRTLRSLARCLRRASRQVDCVARYGGEEFALVLPEAEVEGAQVAMRRVRRAWEALGPVTTFSAGIAVHEAGEDAAETLRRADSALYRAKQCGRNRDVVANDREIVLP